MKLPPKLVLTKVSKHPDLIDRRRGDLEQWLWRVVANAELARSPLVMSFLDLSEAQHLNDCCACQQTCKTDILLPLMKQETANLS
ncbi:hypothetical protein WJX75_008320 [Coccomyxa subellipsoidea]|uniref:PX domain-containing protein n=1 Tax=Coccomyxa subellipsoidea TaxID=248742 RepID=A0ABR2YE88_9CHLO